MVKNNRDRAQRALDALRGYEPYAMVGVTDAGDEDSREQLEETAGDFVADLMHLLDLAGLDWHTVADRGAEHHAAEVAEERQL